MSHEWTSERFFHRDFTWKIPNFFRLPKYEDYSIESPPFSCGSSSWCLRMYPNLRKRVPADDWIDLILVRLHSFLPIQWVSCQFYLKSACGQLYKNYFSESDIGESSQELITCFITYSELLRKKRLASADGSLVVFCKLRTIRNETKNKSVAIETEACECAKRRPGKSVSLQTESCEYAKRRPGKSVSLQTEYFELEKGHLKLAENLKTLLLNEIDCDVTIRVKEREFHAHRAIITARSPVFAAMLKSELTKKATRVINIDDLDPNIFLDFLCFLYTGCIDELSINNVFGLWAAGDKYDIQELKSVCMKFIKNSMSIDTICDIVALSVQHNETELLKEGIDFFVKHLAEILPSVKWQIFLAENPNHGNELFIKALSKLKHI